MGVKAKINGSGDWENCPVGLHNAICVDLIDRGEEDTQFGKKHRVQYAFQVEAISPTTQKPYLIRSSKLTLSMSKKANLFKFIRKWLGPDFVERDWTTGNEVDIEDPFIGRKCMIQVMAFTKTDGTEGTYIETIMPASANNQLKLDPTTYTRTIDREFSPGARTELLVGQPKQDYPPF